MACLLVALLSSWPWLVEPSLRPGAIAPFSATAPAAATVVDSDELEQRRSQMLPRSEVQVIDERATRELQHQLDRHLAQIRSQLVQTQPRVDPISLTASERKWLQSLTPAQQLGWERAVRQAQLRMLRQGLVPNLADGPLLTAASLQLDSQPPPGRSLGSRLMAVTLQGRSNLRIDPFLSQNRIEELVSQQGIPTIKVRKGDLIVRQGERITPQAFDVLDYFDLVNRRPRPLPWLAHFIEAFGACGVMLLVMRGWRASLEPRQALLAVAMLILVQAAKLMVADHSSPLALLVPPTLLLAQGLGTVSGLAWLAIASLLWPFPLDGSMEVRLITAATVAVVAAVLAGRHCNRSQLLLLAVLLPLGAIGLQWLVIQVSVLAGVDTRLPGWGELYNEGLLVGGLLMGGLLVAPWLESSFGLMTRARLMELADLERPLLRRLSTEAPGTFEHTLMICGLAEEGARAIHADVDLIRTGALYHDVGKLHGPQWFIENQEGGRNPHDELDDPFESAAILQAHVDEGLVLAKRYRLPRLLADFIPEHQGTLKMGYFFHQAKERYPDVKQERFRYKGPTPRSRETAILMMADGCEAALRSLPPGTSEADARSMVRRIVEARRRDGQLAASGISLGELEVVIQAFVRVWKRMRHRRIPYPIPARKAFSA